MLKLLYIDDEINSLFLFKELFKKWFTVYTLDDPTKAFDLISKEGINVLITDYLMPGMNGLELAQKLHESFPTVIVIILTAYDDRDIMLQAINMGSIYRYTLKPWNVDELKHIIDSAFDSYELRKRNIHLINDLLAQNKRLQQAYNEISLLKERLEEENIQLKEEFFDPNDSGEIIGQSKSIQQLLKLIKQVAKSDTAILLTGETGTGKELFAKAIHTLSNRKDKLLIRVNCAAIPETLIESELFGYEKGAFTGADKLKYGKFEIANGGSLLLDEIGELPLTTQPKLLRVLQESEFERLGGNKLISTNFRLIAATNRNLEQAVEKGTFRQDLFYRINILPITIPPLRDHAEDIPLLVNHFISSLNKEEGKIINSIAKKTMDRLMEYHWPGNIRELQNVIERAHVLSTGSKLEIGDWFNVVGNKSIIDTTIVSLEENEKQHILRALEQTKWKIRGKNGTAELLQIKPTTLESRMQKLGIQRPK
ncbi:MAG: sigma-54 dependent transcriptional regulator [Tenuifilaceae bacterium]|jgi:DNA-binding NtrC family response regulator|nr:sigma-54 dependent transcriptional regulator [Bacteroidales bacterium]MDI9517236.1 sigma-54 dependent transcriptional regulator [Bacteroidota bacterium]NLH57567.1 sigma-54-dependent Fis family transcriptional regulator [Rikenellaceae bacterium]OQC62455.1 MAG: Formate hydrogenlyase transcriptional activator [Bacteroidetes bacterium ADurb.Bin008]HNV82326.1 sigma-54 dependent transcriptional regulator [Tenuifilaceae bacterium]